MALAWTYTSVRRPSRSTVCCALPCFESIKLLIILTGPFGQHATMHCTTFGTMWKCLILVYLCVPATLISPFHQRNENVIKPLKKLMKGVSWHVLLMIHQIEMHRVIRKRKFGLFHDFPSPGT